MNKREILFEELKARLDQEDFDTALHATIVLYVAYLYKFAKANKEAAEKMMSEVNQTIREEAGWTQ